MFHPLPLVQFFPPSSSFPSFLIFISCFMQPPTPHAPTFPLLFFLDIVLHFPTNIFPLSISTTSSPPPPTFFLTLTSRHRFYTPPGARLPHRRKLPIYTNGAAFHLPSHTPTHHFPTLFITYLPILTPPPTPHTIATFPLSCDICYIGYDDI